MAVAAFADSEAQVQLRLVNGQHACAGTCLAPRDDVEPAESEEAGMCRLLRNATPARCSY